MKKINFLSSVLIIALLITSCTESGNKENATRVDDSTRVDSSHVNSAKTNYVCPMHSDVVSDHADTCTKCGMDLEKVI